MAQPDRHIDVNMAEDQLPSEDPQDFLEEDTLLLNSDDLPDEYYSTAIDAIPDCPMLQVNKLNTEQTTGNQAATLTEKLGCIFVTKN